MYRMLFIVTYATIEQWFSTEDDAYSALADLVLKIGQPKFHNIEKMEA